MEAMASGMPVVCTNIRGNVDLIENGKGGYVVDNRADIVAEAIGVLTKDTHLRDEMGKYNVKAVDTFREERAVEAVEKLMIAL